MRISMTGNLAISLIGVVFWIAGSGPRVFGADVASPTTKPVLAKHWASRAAFILRSVGLRQVDETRTVVRRFPKIQAAGNAPAWRSLGASIRGVSHRLTPRIVKSSYSGASPQCSGDRQIRCGFCRG